MPSAATRSAYQPAMPKWLEARTVAPADAQVTRGADRRIDSDPAGVVAPAVPAVEQDQGRSAAVDDRAGGRVHHAGLDQGDVVRQPRGPVRRDAASVGRHEDGRHVLGDVRRRPHPLDQPRRPGLEEADRDGEAVDGVSVNRHR